MSRCANESCPIGDGQTFHVRDIARGATASDMDRARDALEVLHEHGYVRPLDPEVGWGESGRRVKQKAVHGIVNPIVLKADAAPCQSVSPVSPE